jgi:L-2-hydroxyglutarate oxidase LhgO
MKSLSNEAQEKGALISYNSKVTKIDRTASGYRLNIGENEYEFLSDVVINSAGLGSDAIAALAGVNLEKKEYKIYPCKGCYFRSSLNFNIKRLIYPVPSHNVHNLGIHLTIDLSGSTRFGPDAKYVDDIDYCVDESSKEGFYNAIKKYLPSVTLDSLYPDTSGIRPKTQLPGGPFRDFIIKEESDCGLPGFINLIGIESPGLTSCLAIAEFVENLL